jgi:hypothetical protein
MQVVALEYGTRRDSISCLLFGIAMALRSAVPVCRGYKKIRDRTDDETLLHATQHDDESRLAQDCNSIS